MVREQTMSRRGALKMLAGVTVTGLGTSTATASSETVKPSDSGTQTGTVERTSGQDGGIKNRPKNDSTQLLTGVYEGTVDRIVDGVHVVILIENSGRVIDQHVVNRRELPDIGEGASVRVWIVNGTVRHVWEVA